MRKSEGMDIKKEQKNIIIYGIGTFGTLFRRYCESNNEYNVVVAIDKCCDDKQSFLWGGVNVVSPKRICEYDFDYVFISAYEIHIAREMKRTILGYGVSEEKIRYIFDFEELISKLHSVIPEKELDIRANWLRDYAKYVHDEKLEGDVAECGVYLGNFSLWINRYFWDKKLYLFDTFEGFQARDLEIERALDNKAFINGRFNNSECFNNSNVEIVLRRMPYQKQCEVRKGYFPDTTIGCENKKFCFVNLDMDLYEPQLNGLRFFYDRMVNGGVILLHDYFHPELPGVKLAVDEFRKERHDEISMFPIGDNCSIAIVKH